MTTNAPNLPPGLAYCETDECFNVTSPGYRCEECRDRRLLSRLTNRQIRELISHAALNVTRAMMRPRIAWTDGPRFTWERVLLRLNGEAFRRVVAGRWGAP
jgi:hypothetical protein